MSQETFNIVIYALQEAMKQCVGVNASVKCVLEPTTLANQGFLSTEEENQINNFAKASKEEKTHKKRKVSRGFNILLCCCYDHVQIVIMH